MIDTYRSLETPEGVELNLRVAGPVVRCYAWLIDQLIRMVIYTVLSVLLPFLGTFGLGLLLIAMFFIEWFYPVYFELRHAGATPGKKRMGIRVMHDDGTEVGWQASLLRNLLRAADFLPAFYGFGLLSMLLNRDFKRLGDLTAGTVVVYQETLGIVADVPEATPLAPPVPLTTAEQHTILQFAERADTLTEERRNELADTLTDITGEQGTMATQRLVQYANWLVGRR
jgi:uncharacterized RDD family membrane protein YckC